MSSNGFQFSPGPFKAKDADPEATLERLEKYLESMDSAFRLNRRVNPTDGTRIEFDNRDKLAILRLEGREDMIDLLKHTGKVVDTDTYDEAVAKVKAALKKRGNHTAVVYKLFTGFPQGTQTYDSWHRKVYEHAKLGDWEDYTAEKAAADAIIIQTSSVKLREKALQSNPTYDELNTMGHSQEQARKKAKALPEGDSDEVKMLREEVRKLQVKERGGGGKDSSKEETGNRCDRCRSTRCKRGDKCFAIGKECNKCGETGHFSRSSLCKKNKNPKE